jgi:hypothetical protein
MSTAVSLQTVPGRNCGSCMMCCKLPAIKELQKPLGVWCSYAIRGKGCAIYSKRPPSCEAFYCLWMQDAGLGPEWKPERAKFMVYLQRNGANLQISVDPGFVNAWTRTPYYARIKLWAREGAENGRFVFVRIGQRMIVVLPDRDMDIGPVDPDDEIVIARRPGPAGFDYGVEIRRTVTTTAAAAPSIS